MWKCESSQERKKDIRGWVGVKDKPNIMYTQTQTDVCMYLYIYM